MSTKIYEAYRLRGGSDLWEFLRDTKHRGMKNAETVLTNLYKELVENPGKVEIWTSHGVDFEKHKNRYGEITPNVCDEAIKEAAGKEITKYSCTALPVEVSISVRYLNGWYYFIPYADKSSIFSNIIDFINDDPRIEYYGYWDNTDQPDDVSDAAWEDRSNVWDKLDEDWTTYLSLEITPWTSWFYYSPHYEVFSEWYEKYRESKKDVEILGR